MVGNFKLISVGHKKVNTSDLGHFICRSESDRDLSEQLTAIRSKTAQSEIFYLQTCNRVVFLLFGDKDLTRTDAIDLFKLVNPQMPLRLSKDLESMVDFYVGLTAVRHLYEIASSLDSMVVGEREIFKQFKDAYAWCRRHGLVGDNIRLIEKSAIKAAKDVYTNTQIATRPVSVVSLIIREFLTRQLPKTARILLVGAGDINRDVARHLKKRGYNQQVIFNRSIHNAKKISEEFGIRAYPLKSLNSYKEGFDCIFTCTSAQEPVINLNMYNSLVHDGKQKIVVDLAIPCNVSQRVSSQPQVDYISLESIKIQAEENLKFRSGNIAAAKVILNRHIEEFVLAYDQRKIERAFSQLPEEIRKVKERAIGKVYKDKFDAMPTEAKQLILEITEYMEKKCVAVPMKIARESIRH